MTRFQSELQKIKDSVSDAARIGSREVLRSVSLAKQQLEKIHLLQRRKELCAELGRSLYDAYKDGLPEHIAAFIKETEFVEIIQDIETLDNELKQRQQSV